MMFDEKNKKRKNFQFVKYRSNTNKISNQKKFFQKSYFILIFEKMKKIFSISNKLFPTSNIFQEKKFCLCKKCLQTFLFSLSLPLISIKHLLLCLRLCKSLRLCKCLGLWHDKLKLCCLNLRSIVDKRNICLYLRPKVNVNFLRLFAYSGEANLQPEAWELQTHLEVELVLDYKEVPS